MVYVISKNGEPLMPTRRHRKVRKWLKEGKAKVVRKEPFTIKLLFETTYYTQKLILGVDTGSAMIGAAVTTSDNKILYVSETMIRNDISGKMERRSIYRRARRNRKLRYRKPRFNNRKNSFKTNKFSPTMRSKIQSHIKEIEFIKKILPITILVLETGTFDTQIMKDPTINRHWGYQKGPNYGFENTKAKILDRDNHTCQYCKGRHKDSKLEVHHIIYRSQGGSDEEDNLITLCHTCHHRLHKGEITLSKNGKIKWHLKHATQMNSIRIQLLKHYPKAIETFGYVTKANRLELNLPKEHYYDACIIATGNTQPIIIESLLYKKRHIANGEYQLYQGQNSNKKIPQGKIQGYNLHDKIKYRNIIGFIAGRMSTGYAIIEDIFEQKIDMSNMPRGFKTPKFSNMIKLQARSTTLCISQSITQNIV